jgi:hypothetical protein
MTNGTTPHYRVLSDAVPGNWRVVHADLSLPSPSETSSGFRIIAPGHALARVFLNGSLDLHRERIRNSTSFDGLMMAMEQCVDGKHIDRLRFLHSQDNHLTEEQDPLSLESARVAALYLLNYSTESIFPRLVATSAGNIQIEWRDDERRRLVVECMPDDTVRFVMLYDLEQVAGICPSGDLVSRLTPYPVWKWFHG